jgi:AmmeMemoRadiSam system protein B
VQPPIGLVLPHHLLVEDEIDKVYSQIEDDIERVILISPNHFGVGFNSVQTNSNNEFSEQIGVLHVENERFDMEHGIYSHYEFINKYFANVEIIPIIIKQGASLEILNELIASLSLLDLNNTLIIASIDFSHQIEELEALKSDNKIITWINNHDTVDYADIIGFQTHYSKDPNYEQVALDSPESFYVLFKLFENLGTTHINVLKRTSSSDILKFDEPSLNTSHIFARLLLNSN